MIKIMMAGYVCLLVNMQSLYAQEIPPSGFKIDMQPVGAKLAKTFVTQEMLAMQKQQLIQRIIQAYPQYKGKEHEVAKWYEKTIKVKDYFFYLGQSLGSKFNPEEINEIVAFLSTPAGKKLILHGNFISKESARIAAALVQKHLPSLLAEKNSIKTSKE